MKGNNAKILGSVLAPLICAGCAVPVGQEKGGMPVIVALERSVIHANRDQIDGRGYTVWLAMSHANGMTHAIDRESTDEYHLSITRKLKGKRYWEVCYGPSEQGMIGATYCYYLDYASYELIADYTVN